MSNRYETTANSIDKPTRMIKRKIVSELKTERITAASTLTDKSRATRKIDRS